MVGQEALSRVSTLISFSRGLAMSVALLVLGTSATALAGSTGCGDGLPAPGEQCDDGNTSAGDGCDANCAIELPFACSEADGTSALGDPGLELGGDYTTSAPNPFWTESGSIDLGGGRTLTPICSESLCLPSGSSDGFAPQGEHFAWFGGEPEVVDQLQEMTQTVTLAASQAAELSFYRFRGRCHSALADTLEVRIDATTITTLTCDAPDMGWVHDSFDVSAFADGAAHELSFVARTNGSNPQDFTSIFVDFIHLGSLSPLPGVCENRCGDARPDGTEACDDGNLVDGDGCSSQCAVEPGFACTAAVAPACIDAVVDPGFEVGGLNEGSPNPFWAESSTTPVFPICAPIGVCNDLTGDRTGSGLRYARFGGVPDTQGTVNTQSVTQSVEIAPGATVLDYYLRRAACAPTPSGDALELYIDDVLLDSVACSERDIAYLHRRVDLVVAGVNDGGSHTLRLDGLSSGGDSDGQPPAAWSELLVDDVSICTGSFSAARPSMCTGDSDGDGITDDSDNCLIVANPAQRDSDDDGIGNRCDTDLDQSCFVNLVDLSLFKPRFRTDDADADFSGDGFVNLVDLGILKSRFQEPPGPSGVPNLCMPDPSVNVWPALSR